MKSQANHIRNRVVQTTLFLFCLVFFISCSTSTRQLFFDIQPPSAEEIAAQNRLDNERREETLGLLDSQQKSLDSKAMSSVGFDDKLPRPEVESVENWEQVAEMLPKDYKKQVDWKAALDQGLVRPRTGADPKSLYATGFQYDFIIAAEKPKNEGYFPHSAHTTWLGCKNCHMTLYPAKRNPATMKEMRAGVSCGACHGKVAFSLKACKRCHLNR
jgi:c(7)-type cytochrome triheme protein